MMQSLISFRNGMGNICLSEHYDRVYVAMVWKEGSQITTSMKYVNSFKRN